MSLKRTSNGKIRHFANSVWDTEPRCSNSNLTAFLNPFPLLLPTAHNDRWVEKHELTSHAPQLSLDLKAPLRVCKPEQLSDLYLSDMMSDQSTLQMYFLEEEVCCTA